MQEQHFSGYHPGLVLSREIERRAESAKSGARQRARSRQHFSGGRKLTQGELREVRWMFGPMPGVERARIFSRNFWWPFPNKRAMTPWGDIYFPHQDFYEDFSAPNVPVELRAVFMHEATHLYQWYALGMWVWITGPLDREYDYVLDEGRALRAYRLEQMGQIVQDFYLLRHGRKLPTRAYPLSAYADALPVRG